MGRTCPRDTIAPTVPETQTRGENYVRGGVMYVTEDMASGRIERFIPREIRIYGARFGKEPGLVYRSTGTNFLVD